MLFFHEFLRFPEVYTSKKMFYEPKNIPIVLSYPYLTYKQPDLAKKALFLKIIKKNLLRGGGYPLSGATLWKTVHDISEISLSFIFCFEYQLQGAIRGIHLQ